MKHFLTLLAALLLTVAATAASGPKYKEITGSTAYGKEIHLSDFAGKGDYVLVDFWASWCAPCMKAVPVLREMLEKYSDKGLTLVGVNSWERSENAGQDRARQMNMTWPVIFAEQEALEPYGIKAVPTLILISPSGEILERLTGEAGIERMLKKHLGD